MRFNTIQPAIFLIVCLLPSALMKTSKPNIQIEKRINLENEIEGNVVNTNQKIQEINNNNFDDDFIDWRENQDSSEVNKNTRRQQDFPEFGKRLSMVNNIRGGSVKTNQDILEVNYNRGDMNDYEGYGPDINSRRQLSALPGRLDKIFNKDKTNQTNYRPDLMRRQVSQLPNRQSIGGVTQLPNRPDKPNRRQFTQLPNRPDESNEGATQLPNRPDKQNRRHPFGFLPAIPDESNEGVTQLPNRPRDQNRGVADYLPGSPKFVKDMEVGQQISQLPNRPNESNGGVTQLPNRPDKLNRRQFTQLPNRPDESNGGVTHLPNRPEKLRRGGAQYNMPEWPELVEWKKGTRRQVSESPNNQNIEKLRRGVTDSDSNLPNLPGSVEIQKSFSRRQSNPRRSQATIHNDLEGQEVHLDQRINQLNPNKVSENNKKERTQLEDRGFSTIVVDDSGEVFPPRSRRLDMINNIEGTDVNTNQKITELNKSRRRSDIDGENKRRSSKKTKFINLDTRNGLKYSMETRDVPQITQHGNNKLQRVAMSNDIKGTSVNTNQKIVENNNRRISAPIRDKKSDLISEGIITSDDDLRRIAMSNDIKGTSVNTNQKITEKNSRRTEKSRKNSPMIDFPGKDDSTIDNNLINPRKDTNNDFNINDVNDIDAWINQIVTANYIKASKIDEPHISHDHHHEEDLTRIAMTNDIKGTSVNTNQKITEKNSRRQQVEHVDRDPIKRRLDPENGEILSRIAVANKIEGTSVNTNQKITEHNSRRDSGAKDQIGDTWTPINSGAKDQIGDPWTPINSGAKDQIGDRWPSFNRRDSGAKDQNGDPPINRRIQLDNNIEGNQVDNTVSFYQNDESDEEDESGSDEIVPRRHRRSVAETEKAEDKDKSSKRMAVQNTIEGDDVKTNQTVKETNAQKDVGSSRRLNVKNNIEGDNVKTEQKVKEENTAATEENKENATDAPNSDGEAIETKEIKDKDSEEPGKRYRRQSPYPFIPRDPSVYEHFAPKPVYARVVKYIPQNMDVPKYPF